MGVGGRTQASRRGSLGMDCYTTGSQMADPSVDLTEVVYEIESDL